MGSIRSSLNIGQSSECLKVVVFCLLLFACSCPPSSFLHYAIITSKWHMTVLAILSVVIIYVWRLQRCEYRLDDVAAGNVCALPVAALLVLSYNLIYALVVDIIVPGVYDWRMIHLRGVFDNPTGLAMHISLLTALALPLLRQGGIWWRRAAYFILPLAACAVFLTGCRAGMLCMALTGSTLLIQSTRLMRLRRVLTACVMMAFAAVIITTKTESTAGRRFIIERTWELIREQPIAGYGIHGFDREYMPKQAEYFRFHSDAENAWRADEISHPLNEFLWLWNDFGVCAPIVLMLILVAPFVIHYKKRSASFKGYGRLPVMAVLIVFAMTSYPHLYPMAWLSLAAVYAMICRRWVQRRICSKCVAMAVTIVCLAAMTWTGKEIYLEHRMYLLNQEVRRGNSTATMDGYKKMYGHYRHSPRFLYSMMFAQYQARHFSDAADTYKELTHYVRNYDMELLMGDVCRHAGYNDEALQHYEEAHYMVPVRFAPLAGMMKAYDMMGDSVRADSITGEILRKPIKVPSAEVDRIRHEAERRLIVMNNEQ